MEAIQVNFAESTRVAYGRIVVMRSSMSSGSQDPVHVHDLQATILHLLGIDHERLTYKHQGRRYRLTDVHGHVVKPLVA